MNIPVIVISLKRSEARRSRIKKELERCNIDSYYIYDAFDGSNMTNHTIEPKVLPPSFGHGRDMKKGELGCTLSHIGALTMAKTLNWDYVIILEDDSVLCEDFESRLKEVWRLAPRDWEHIFLGGHTYGINSLITPALIPSPKVSGTYAYMVHSQAYDKIITKLSELTTTTDDLYEQLIRNNQLKSYVFFPLFSYPLLEYSYIHEEESGSKEHESKKYWKDKL